MAATEVDFTNLSLNATSYSWNFGDGTTSTVTNPTHAYAQPGVYIARLTAFGPGGTSASAEKVVSVLGSTVINFLATDNLDQLTDDLGNELVVSPAAQTTA